MLKEDGSWRPCGDYRSLNLATKPNTYPLLNIQDPSARLHGCRIFSKLDLRKGYYQIPVREEDIHKTLWEFRQMPFGLRKRQSGGVRTSHDEGLAADWTRVSSRMHEG